MSESNKDTALGEIPENWQVSKLFEFAKVVTGNTPPTKNVESYGGSYIWVTPSDISGSKYIYSTGRKLSNIGFEKCRKLPPNSLLVTCIASIGKNCIIKEEGSCNQQINAILPSSSHDTDYLYYFLENNIQQLKALTGTTAVPIINKSNFERFQVLLPPLPEQQKIAKILSTVDDKIDVIGEQIEQAQELKKGLMQRLLTKGIGHTKFKDSPFGQIPESWEIVKQSDVATFYNGRAYKLTEWETTGTPVIRLQNLTGSGKEYYYSNLTLPEHQYCSKGDLLYMWSATFGPVWWEGEKAIYHYHIWKIEVKQDQLDKTFLYYLLDNVTMRMKNQSHGSTMLHVTKGGMEKLEIALPPLNEQQEIAEILSTVDEKLEVLNEKRRQYQELKKALMQQLLTGKMRVAHLIEQTELA